MIDLKKLRDDEAYRAGAIRKGAESGVIDQLLAAEDERRELLAEVEGLRAEQNAASKEIGRAAPDERDAKIAAAGELKAGLEQRESLLARAQGGVDDLILSVPNPAHESVPDGGEEDFELIDVVGTPIAAPPMDHADYGDFMNWTDTELGAAVSGSRFAYLRNEAVLLEFALAQYAMQKLVSKGFSPVIPPVLVREDMMIDSGFFPTDRNQVYELGNDDLYLVGTSEVPLAGMHRGDRLDASGLPLRYAGFSSCFRREAGTYGKDTRGIFRVHQFDKIEMFIWSDPANSWAEHELLLSIEREILDELGFSYRVINVASGDLGAAAAKKYDCEVWLPSEGAYRELTSCSNYLDYSARRLQTRVKSDEGTAFVHTLNGTACAVGRTLVFLMEHCQQADGTFVVPEVLQPFCGLTVIEPPATAG